LGLWFLEEEEDDEDDDEDDDEEEGEEDCWVVLPGVLWGQMRSLVSGASARFDGLESGELFAVVSKVGFWRFSPLLEGFEGVRGVVSGVVEGLGAPCSSLELVGDAEDGGGGRIRGSQRSPKR
jgi:hypothetical protein